MRTVSQHMHKKLITFHHANTRGSRAGRIRISHLCVLEQLSSTCHVSFIAAPDTDHKHKFSLTCLTYLSDNLTHTRHSVHDPYLPYEDPRQSGGSTQIPFLTESPSPTTWARQPQIVSLERCLSKMHIFSCPLPTPDLRESLMSSSF